MIIPLNNQPGGGQPPYYDDLFKIPKTESGLYYRPSLAYTTQPSFSVTGTYRMYLCPFVPPEDIDVTEIGMYQNGVNAQGLVMGIYNSEDPVLGHFGAPGTLLISGASIPAPADGANISTIASTTLKKGVLYWLAFKSENSGKPVTSISQVGTTHFAPYYSRGPVQVATFGVASEIPSMLQCFYKDPTSEGNNLVLDADLSAGGLTAVSQTVMLFVGPTP